MKLKFDANLSCLALTIKSESSAEQNVHTLDSFLPMKKLLRYAKTCFWKKSRVFNERKQKLKKQKNEKIVYNTKHKTWQGTNIIIKNKYEQNYSSSGHLGLAINPAFLKHQEIKIYIRMKKCKNALLV